MTPRQKRRMLRGLWQIAFPHHGSGALTGKIKGTSVGEPGSLQPSRKIELNSTVQFPGPITSNKSTEANPGS